MAKVLPQIVLLLVVVFSNSNIYSQDEDLECRTANPFCSDASRELTFPNVTGEDINFQGLGCLNTTRNSSWYFIRIDQPGELIFDIQQWVDGNDNSNLDRGERQLDVDFIAWGPFTTSFVPCDILATGCDNNGDGENLRPEECVNNVDDPDYYVLNEDNTNIVDCSYARTPEDDIFIETFTIPNAQSGEYYIILITNFSDEPGVIQLQQTNLDEPNAGTTDCSILEEGLPDDIDTCGPELLDIQGRFDDAVRYQWSLFNEATGAFEEIAGAEDPFFTTTGPGRYQLEGFDISGNSVGVDDIVITDVTNSLTSVSYTIQEESFAGSYTITAVPEIAIGELEDFEFRLDRNPLGVGFVEYRPYQSSPVFTNVPPGDYFITARHIAGCSEVQSLVIMILGYPKYFTPNGDGFHDTWSLINIEGQPGALIYIFDRYGKLLKQIRPGGPGWDGTYNGKIMPSSDYWFRVEFNEPRDPNMRRRTFAGSFSLIR